VCRRGKLVRPDCNCISSLRGPPGGLFGFSILVLVPSPKAWPKAVSAPERGSLCVKDAFAKKFFGARRDSAGAALAFEGVKRLSDSEYDATGGLASIAPMSPVRKLGLLQVRHRLLRRAMAQLCLNGVA
jgi:hypothetical protein